MTTKSFHTKKRRSGRIIIELPIHISGTDVNGKGFSVLTHTLILSRHGAKILLEKALIEGQEIIISSPGNQKEAEARVVRLFAKEPEGYSYGIEFLGQESNYWDISFLLLPLTHSPSVQIKAYSIDAAS